MKNRRESPYPRSVEETEKREISPAEELGSLIIELATSRRARKAPITFLRIAGFQIKMAAMDGDMEGYLAQADVSYAKARQLIGERRGGGAVVTLWRLRALKAAGLDGLALTAIDGSVEEWTTAIGLQKVINGNGHGHEHTLEYPLSLDEVVTKEETGETLRLEGWSLDERPSAKSFWS